MFLGLKRVKNDQYPIYLDFMLTHTHTHTHTHCYTNDTGLVLHCWTSVTSCL